MTSIPMTNQQQTSNSNANQMPVPVQVISTLMFGGFSIAAVAMAFSAFWLAGVVVAIVLGWRGGFAPGMWSNPSIPSPQKLMALSPEVTTRSGSGNASFDAYRSDTLERLEQEQDKFENFLSRLRDAKDKSEFDDFMDQRAQRVIEDRFRDHETERG